MSERGKIVLGAGGEGGNQDRSRHPDWLGERPGRADEWLRRLSCRVQRVVVALSFAIQLVVVSAKQIRAAASTRDDRKAA